MDPSLSKVSIVDDCIEQSIPFNPILSSCPLSDAGDTAFSEDMSEFEPGDISASPSTLSCDGSDILDRDQDNGSCLVVEPYQSLLGSEDNIESNVRLSVLITKSEDNPKPTKVSGDSGTESEFECIVVRRATSLKTGKTPPPGSAHRKKEVRFADALGLDLESVRHIINSSDPPVVPVSALRDLNTQTDGNDFTPYRRRLLHACFSQPGTSPLFPNRVAERRVALQSCTVLSNVIDGLVCVANVAYEKHVTVRYTLDGWTTYQDIPAVYVSSSSNGSCDQFHFTISLPDTFGMFGRVLEFSIRYTAGSGNDQEFWDSNFGANYRVECYTV